MSARKIAVNESSFNQNVTLGAGQTRLTLSEDSVLIRKNGIEFRSPAPFSPWTEMTITLQSVREDSRVNCSGVVISCAGNKHTGYRVSMVFTGLTKQAETRLSTLASSVLG